jgi:hypothetical protein
VLGERRAFATNHYNGLGGRRIPSGTKKIRRAGFALVHFARLTFRFRVLPSGEASSYSRSVLGASSTLTSWRKRSRGEKRRCTQFATFSFSNGA